MRKADKLQLLAGIAAVSAVIAMVLILSSLPVIVPLLSEFISQLPASAVSAEEIIGRLAQIRVATPNVIDLFALLAIAGFMFLSITTTVAVSKIHARYNVK